MKLYHATDKENLVSIITEGIKPDAFGDVYFAESYEQALAFMVFRHIQEIIIFEIEMDISKCRESFDHSEAMFCRMFGFETCRAWCYEGTIPAELINLNNCKVYKK